MSVGSSGLDWRGSLPEAGYSRLSGPERRIARRWYDASLRRAGAGADDDARRQAMNLAFIAVARGWLAVAGPIGFVASGFWSFHNGAGEIATATVATLITLALLLGMSLRWRQARQFWPAKVVLRHSS